MRFSFDRCVAGFSSDRLPIARPCYPRPGPSQGAIEARKLKKLAQATLDYLLFLSVTDERKLDPDLAEENLDALRMHFEDASAEERAALSAAAQSALNSASAVEDEDRHTSPQLLSDRERAILTSIVDGSLFELVDDEDEDEDWTE